MNASRTALKRALRAGGVSTGLIKGDASSTPAEGLVPGFSATGQDVWLPSATHFGPGLVLSAVGARCGKVFQADGSWSVVANTVVLTPQPGHHPRYLWYLVNDEEFWEKGGTAQPYVRVPETLARKVWLPSLETQRAIADFLDTETARIDALIAKKQRMVELLDERRQATIHTATTRGLGKATNDDGLVEARGLAAPVHWTVAPLSTLCAFQAGKAHEPYIDEDGEFICVNSRFISTDGQVVKRCNRNLSPARPTDVLMVMSDLPNGRALAKAFYVEDAGTYAVNQRVCIISPRLIHPRYAYYQLDRNPGFLRFDDGSNQTHLSNSIFRKFMMCVPPQAEQRAIAEYLDAITGSIRSASQGLATQISLLRERRQTLITGAVTGELEVPGVAA